ncbi:MAG: hypothetical protein GY893_12840 [bacterium]|nr:hypothetical protein [bacterium]
MSNIKASETKSAEMISGSAVIINILACFLLLFFRSGRLDGIAGFVYAFGSTLVPCGAGAVFFLVFIKTKYSRHAFIIAMWAIFILSYWGSKLEEGGAYMENMPM